MTYNSHLLETVTDVEEKATHKRSAILKHKSVRNVARKGILLKYAEQPKNSKARKILPNLPQEKLNQKDNSPILWITTRPHLIRQMLKSLICGECLPLIQ